LTSRDGIIPLNFFADVGGPMARSVADAATVLGVVAGHDPADPITKMAENSSGKAETDYRKYLVKDGLRGARIGVVRRYVDAETGDPQVKALMEKAIADLKAQGAEIVDPFVIPEYDKLTEKIGCGDFQKDVNAYLALHAPNAYYKSLSEIVDSGLYLPYIEAQMKRNVAPKTEAQLARGRCVDTYHDPKKIAFRDAVLGEMEKQHVDALVYPTWSNPPRKVGDMKSPAGDNSQVLSPQTGFPAITVPMGFTHDSLPAGMTILGRLFSEGLLIKYAYAYEQATKHRRPPAGFGPAE
jgi:Asp-tRNA(Asn)/Glu-tRNA(Gln) amidotransferase A subunit family amidase